MLITRTISKLIFVFALTFIFVAQAHSQTKKLKRPSSRVGISSVDTFVRESFDLYDKVYMYDGYAEAGKPLSDDDIDVLENALDDLANLSDSAPDIIGDLDGAGVLKQSKATLQINRSKKALSYSIKTAKKLLANNKRSDDSEEEQDNDTSSQSDTDAPQDGSLNDQNEAEEESEDSNLSDDLEVYSKFDFVPGDKLVYFDDFSQDFIGDFPSKWNTNGSGEVVRLSKIDGNWFEMKPGHGIMYIPLVGDKLPEEYTIEFDLFTEGLGRQTSSTARLFITLDDNGVFINGKANAFTTLPFGQYGAFGIRVANNAPSGLNINSTITADIRKAVVNNPHVSIAVNKKRFRLWVNERKYVDIPQLIYNPDKIGFLKFSIYGTKDGQERIFISNLKIAEGGVDLRRQLMSEGRVSTNGILFRFRICQYSTPILWYHSSDLASSITRCKYALKYHWAYRFRWRR